MDWRVFKTTNIYVAKFGNFVVTCFKKRGNRARIPQSTSYWFVLSNCSKLSERHQLYFILLDMAHIVVRIQSYQNILTTSCQYCVSRESVHVNVIKWVAQWYLCIHTRLQFRFQLNQGWPYKVYPLQLDGQCVTANLVTIWKKTGHFLNLLVNYRCLSVTIEGPIFAYCKNKKKVPGAFKTLKF